MPHALHAETRAANARLLLELMRLEATIFAPLTGLMIYLITHRVDVAAGISGAIFIASLLAFTLLYRHFSKAGVLTPAVRVPVKH